MTGAQGAQGPDGAPGPESGATGAAGVGQQIVVQAWTPNDSGATACYIVKQRAARSYTVTSLANSAKTGKCTLVSGAPSQAGECSIAITVNGATEYVHTLYQNTVKTFSGNRYKWVLEGEAIPDGNTVVLQSA